MRGALRMRHPSCGGFASLDSGPRGTGDDFWGGLAVKYVFQFLRILAFCFLGEVLHGLLPLPIPASIYGLALLLAALKTGFVKLEQVAECARFLIVVFPLLFVPGAAGIMELGPLLAQIWLPALLGVAVVTVLVMAAAGRVTQAVSRRKEARHD